MLKFNILTVKQKRNKSHQENYYKEFLNIIIIMSFYYFYCLWKAPMGKLTIKFV